METKKYGKDENSVKEIDDELEIFKQEILKRKNYQKKKPVVSNVCDHKNTVIDQHFADIICTNCGKIIVERLNYEEINF